MDESESVRRQKRAFLALASIPGWGYWTLKLLASRKTDFGALLHLDEQTVRERLREAGLRSPPARAPWPEVAEAAWKAAAHLDNRLQNAGVQLVLRGTADYPLALEDLHDPPEWLFVRGALNALTLPSIAVVGTRTPTADGMWLVGWLTDALGVVAPGATISGLATGIDQAIHEGSLVAGVPTVAVLGTGIFTEFPLGSNALADKIVRAAGAIVSEYLPLDKYSKASFVRRNRIQAALARVVLPVEWKVASGTAHTIGFAEELRRPLVALRRRTRAADNPELVDLERRGGRVFTIVGDEDAFVDVVRHHLRDVPRLPVEPSAPTQLKLV